MPFIVTPVLLGGEFKTTIARPLPPAERGEQQTAKWEIGGRLQTKMMGVKRCHARESTKPRFAGSTGRPPQGDEAQTGRAGRRATEGSEPFGAGWAGQGWIMADADN